MVKVRPDMTGLLKFQVTNSRINIHAFHANIGMMISDFVHSHVLVMSSHASE